MFDINAVKEHMEVIGADGVHLGTVDRVEGNRIKLTRADSGSHAGSAGRFEDESAFKDEGAGQSQDQGHHHYISAGLIAAIEDGKVRLSATAANAALLEEEEAGNGIADEPAISVAPSPASADDEVGQQAGEMTIRGGDVF